MKLSSLSPHQATYLNHPKFGDPTKVEAVVRQFDGESRPAGHNWNSMQPQTIVMSSLPTNYSHPATGPDTAFGASLPSHVGAHLQTKLTESALWHTNTSKTHPDMCRMDKQTQSSGLMTLVPNVMKEYIRPQIIMMT